MSRWLIPILVSLLALIGLLTLKSVAPDLAGKQLLFFVSCGLLAWWVSRQPLAFWFTYSGWFYWGLTGLLLFLLIRGSVTRGITAWLDFGWAKFQPSQLAVLVTTLYLCPVLNRIEANSLTGLLKISGLILLPGLLIAAEPDLGTAVVYLASLSLVFLLVAFPTRYLIGSAGLGLMVIVLVWLFGLKNYQRQRLVSFLAPPATVDQSAAGYNSRQALIAIGSGGLWGRGLGFGGQSHLKFLPERQTDFIFAAIAEEWGWLGSMMVVIIYLLLIGQLLVAAHQVLKPAPKLVLLVSAAFLLVEVTINIGMNLKLLPITGITLPFLSSGGSSILAFSLLLAIDLAAIRAGVDPKYQRIS